jgi:CheY-like chemotaxis protein
MGAPFNAGSAQPRCDMTLTKPVRLQTLTQCLTRLFSARIASRPIEGDTHADGALEEESSKHVPASNATRILVAEDNKINMRLILAVLEREGFDVECVENGIEAVASVRLKDYDVILMDVQMPGMDGVEATRRIRAFGGRKGRIPIVALTANAMTGAREEYLAAGMDEYLSKPINRLELLGLIKKLIEAGHENPVTGEISKPPTDQAAEAPDLDDAQLAAVQAVLRASDFSGLVSSYVDTASDRANRILDLAKRGDYAGLARAAHDLKGIAGNFGARRVHLLARDLETACKSARAEAIDGLVAEIAVAATRASEAMRDRFLREAS